jgi:hypothetical protein
MGPSPGGKKGRERVILDWWRDKVVLAKVARSWKVLVR